MKKLSITIILGIACYAGAGAQNIQPSDMLMSSQTYPWGTARAMGMGSAFGALGADQTSLSINPAGIGVYRTSDLSLSLSVNDNTSQATYMGHTTSDFSDKLKVSNVGLIYTSNSKKEQGWVSASFGFAYNRLNDFNRHIVINAPHATSSLLDEFTYYANDMGNGPLAPSTITSSSDPGYYYEGLAWSTYLLDKRFYSDGWYSSDFSYTHNYGQSQRRVRDINGGIGESDFSFGANYSNKFYIGATIGIQTLKYEETSDHTETDVNGNIDYLQSFTFSQYLNIYGTGLNFKTGIIFKPIDLLRFGVAIHTPTYYSFSSDYHTRIDAYYDRPVTSDNSSYSSEELPERTANNTLHTPWKFIGSAAFQLQQYGLISVDYERVDYSRMKLSGDDVFAQNDSVRSQYKAGNNVRVGAEGKIGSFAIRGGYGYYSTPYKKADLKKINYQTYSLGVGYRGKSFYCDLAYVLLKYSDKYSLYQVGPEMDNHAWGSNDPADIKYDLNRFVATIGFRF